MYNLKFMLLKPIALSKKSLGFSDVRIFSYVDCVLKVTSRLKLIRCPLPHCNNISLHEIRLQLITKAVRDKQ